MSYVGVLRWESRLVITYLVVGAALSVISLPLAILLGTGLAATFMLRIRRDYTHTTTIGSVLGVIPPLAIGLVLFGLVQTWMERVGFGPMMRISVVTALGTAVGMQATGAPLALLPLLALTALLTATLREMGPANLYLVPIGVAGLVTMLVAS